MALPLARLVTDKCEVTTLYRELRKPLLRWLVCLGLSADEAQDVVQDAFVSLQRHLAAGGSQENIRSWLFRVARNGARNRQRSYERRFSEPLDAEVAMVHEATRHIAACVECLHRLAVYQQASSAFEAYCEATAVNSDGCRVSRSS